MTEPTQTETQPRTSPLTKLVDIITRTRHSSQPAETDHTEALDVLASDRRRYIIEYLADQHPGETMSTSDLAEYVAARENECEISKVTSEQRSRVYIAGHQQHLPKLDKCGYVRYDPDRGTVAGTDRVSRVWKAYLAFQSALTG